MTCSNGMFNPNPFANPFNTRLGPANYSLNQFGKSYSSKTFNSSNALLPDPVMLEDPRMRMPGQDLEVPNLLDNCPIGNLTIDRAAISMRYPNSYVAPDGTVFDLDSKKIVFLAKTQPHSSNEWESCKDINLEDVCGTWDDNEINRLPLDNSSMQLDHQSREYWQSIDNSRPLIDKPTSDLQKELLADLENGMFVGHSKLVDEN